MRRTALLLSCVLLSLPAFAQTRALGELRFESCDVPVPAGAGYRAECTSFSVPEDRADPERRRIHLRIVLVASQATRPEPEPVLLLAGGPGQSASEAYPLVMATLAPLTRHRHVLLVDQRGTGGSNRLPCPMPDALDAEDITPAAARIHAAECLAAIGARADSRFYTTSDYIRDLEDVRRALGGPQINLIGGSYGTRVALEYLRRHPEAIRSVVIDSVVPPELALLQEHARNLDEALTRIFERCREHAACAERFGDPAGTLAALRRELREAPRRVEFIDARGFQLRQETFNDVALASFLRFFAYQPEAASLLPLLLDEALKGRAAPLMAQLPRLEDLADQLAHGMELSVLCAEDIDLIEPDPRDAQRVLGDRMIPYLRAQCEIWPHGRRPADFKTPVRSDRPVLILSGELDPVTPPRYGDQVARTLTRSLHLVARGQGHLVMTRGCLPRLVRHFIEAPDRELDVACIENFGYTPAFVSYQGPPP